MTPPRRFDSRELEAYSSAVTLSDMEIFIFPNLLYSLVLANIMSPRVWAWRERPWFDGLDRLSPYRRIQRLKQFIIDQYEFNLDLTTWGLTTKQAELARFRPFIDEATLSESNALFGYEGDKYYFDLDIRRHFGLDQFTTDSIPYWKTETVEAMDAFVHRPGYHRGAGECVSLAALYAAALFVVCRIPLADIFLMATPLHSQNFIDVQAGVLTNNRRIVTRNMWFNGTELTARAQRALRNEQITVVANHSGYVHSVYPEATMDPADYTRFQERLLAFARTDITPEVLANFLREHRVYQRCFQLEHGFHGASRYIGLEHVYAYEHSSSYRVNDRTRSKLLDEVDEYLFFAEPIDGRILLNGFDEFFSSRTLDLDREADQQMLRERFHCDHGSPCDIIRALMGFVRLEPRFPDAAGEKHFQSGAPIELGTDMNRGEVIAYVEGRRTDLEVADLAFYAARDLSRTDWEPFLKAALERNPVCVEASADLSDDALLATLEAFSDASIYDEARLAQPDEVWNCRRGDGVEKAITLAAIWRRRHPDAEVDIHLTADAVRIRLGEHAVDWASRKPLAAGCILGSA